MVGSARRAPVGNDWGHRGLQDGPRRTEKESPDDERERKLATETRVDCDLWRDPVRSGRHDGPDARYLQQVMGKPGGNTGGRAEGGGFSDGIRQDGEGLVEEAAQAGLRRQQPLDLPPQAGVAAAGTVQVGGALPLPRLLQGCEIDRFDNGQVEAYVLASG